MKVEKILTTEDAEAGFIINHEWTVVDDWYMVPESKLIYHFHGKVASHTVSSEPNSPGKGIDSFCVKCRKQPSEEIVNLLYFLCLDVKAVHQYWRSKWKKQSTLNGY